MGQGLCGRLEVVDDLKKQRTWRVGDGRKELLDDALGGEHTAQHTAFPDVSVSSGNVTSKE